VFRRQESLCDVVQLFSVSLFAITCAQRTNTLGSPQIQIYATPTN
jgi:hypothetical protein